MTALAVVAAVMAAVATSATAHRRYKGHGRRLGRAFDPLALLDGYPTGQEPLLSPAALQAALPPGLACGAVVPNTSHVVDCGWGRPGRVPPGTIAFQPRRVGGAPPPPRDRTTLLFLHGQSSAPLTQYLPLVVGLLSTPASAGLRLLMPIAPRVTALRVGAVDGADGGAAAWMNLYVPPPAGVAAAEAATNDTQRVAIATAHPWAMDSLDLALSVTRLRRIAAFEVASGRRVAVVGHSLGAGAALHLTALSPPDTFAAVLAVAGPLPLADEYVAGTLSSAGRGGVVLLHGTADTTIPASAGRVGAAVWGDGARFRAVEGASHAGVLGTPPMVEEVGVLLGRACAVPGQT